MNWQFNNDMPIYTQLVAQIKFAIVSGELPPGVKLPTVRELAAEAGVNPNTMQRAFAELERDELVYAQRSSGRFVTLEGDIIARAKLALAEAHIDSYIAAMRALGYGMEEMVQLLQSREEDINDNT